MFCTYEKENTGKVGRVQQRINCSADKKKIRAQKELEENPERFQIFARGAAAWAHGRRVPTGSGRAGPPRRWRRRRAARAHSGRGCGGARGEARSGRGCGSARGEARSGRGGGGARGGALGDSPARGCEFRATGFPRPHTRTPTARRRPRVKECG